MLGIVLSMFTALFVTKMLLNSFLELGVQNPKMYGKAKEPKIHGYVKNFKICGVASLIVIIAGLAFLGVNHSRIGKSLNYSLSLPVVHQQLLLLQRTMYIHWSVQSLRLHQ